MSSLNHSRTNAFDDPMLTPTSSPRKMASPKTSDKTSQDCRGISSGVTILRPQSPTTKCSTEEKGLMELVQRSIKDTFSDGVPWPWEDLISAFTANIQYRSPSGAFIPDIDLKMYWCNFCAFESKEKRELIDHSMSHRFKCNYCDHECFTRVDVVKHSIRAHPEYKQTCHALKACMLLHDLLEQDETSILYDGQNDAVKTDSSLHHLHYNQECANSNHGSTGAGTGEFQNPLSSLKVADSFSIFQSKKSASTTGTIRTPVGLITDVASSNPVSSSENKTPADRTFGFVADARSLNPLYSSENENKTPTPDLSVSVQSLVNPTGETGLQTANVQSSAITSIKADLLTSDGTNENDKGKKGVDVDVESFETPTTQPQNAAKETIQLLDSLINPLKVAAVKRKAEVQITGAAPPPPPPPALEVTIITEVNSNSAPKAAPAANAGKMEPATPTSSSSSKRKAYVDYAESTAEEDSDADPDYEPESVAGGRPKRLMLQRSSKKKRLGVLPTPKPSPAAQPPQKDVSVTAEKKYRDLESLAVGTFVYRCGYCRYRSLKKNKVEGHVREKHSLELMNYSKQVVNSSRQLVRTDLKPASSETGDGNGEEGGSSGDKYSCMYCKYQSDDLQVMKKHLFKSHTSKKFCCIDNHLKASDEKNFYTFFCCRNTCDFQSVSPQKFIKHVEKCTGIPNKGSGEGSKPTGLQQSVLFAQNLVDQEKMELDGDTLSSSKKKEEPKKDSKKEAPSCSYSAPTPVSSTSSKKD